MVLSLFALLSKYRKAAFWGAIIIALITTVTVAYRRHERAVAAIIEVTREQTSLEMLNADLNNAAALRNRVADGRTAKRLRPKAREGDQRGYRD